MLRTVAGSLINGNKYKCFLATTLKYNVTKKLQNKKALQSLRSIYSIKHNTSLGKGTLWFLTSNLIPILRDAVGINGYVAHV